MPLIDLLPCPFCGGAAIFGWFAVTPNIHCPACRYEMDGEHGDTEGASVVAAWNTRALPALTPDPLGAEWMRRRALAYCATRPDECISAEKLCCIPSPTDADLDRAALARPKVRALVEAAIKAKIVLEIYEDEEMAGELRAAIAALKVYTSE